MDLFGPISIKSIGGTKDETADILQYLILSLESLCKLKVRRIRKRKNKTLIETARTMLSDVKLPVNLWAEAIARLSFNLPDLSIDDAANEYELFGGGDDSSFSTRATIAIVTPDSNAESASQTHDSDNIEGVHVDGNDAQANPNTRVGN
ncbi:hypothetical protein L1987_70982 [Smallanthus sonchifolius]|uniref:Uncharacterized protein n=1 Tax=Smallanthus sonchifolius TaxID=185202 RepID=A0ACB9ARU2_9ASTR|nr:hypothetical protein L1987_70982 [Smallanthus sonchifolius]